jgi:hypothetical protein
MASVVWTLSVAGVEKPFASWNAKKPSLTFRNMDVDECTFTINGDVRSAAPMNYGAAVKVKRNGVCVFIGIVVDVRSKGTPKTSVWSIVCKNAWYQLSQTMFQQTMAVYDGVTCIKGQKSTTKVVLFQDPITGAAITTGTQIANVITYALTQGIVIAAGTAPAFVNVPFETARDLTLADVIRRCMQWTPDAVGWFDYSSGVPVFNCQQRAALSASSLNLASSPAVVKSFDLGTRDDLVPSGVRFNYVGMKVCPPAAGDPSCPPLPDGGTQQFSTVTQDDSGLVSVWGSLIGTVELAQLSDATTEAAPIGLAAQYYLSLVTPMYQGSVTTQQQECAANILVGKVLNLTGGVAAWTTMRALVQQVHLNLSTGETEIAFGPPDHLSPQNFAWLVQMMRRRGLVANSFPKTRAPGDGGTPNCDAGMDPDAKKVIDKLKGNAGLATDGLNKGSTGTQNNIGGSLAVHTLHACEDGTEVVVSFYGP